MPPYIPKAKPKTPPTTFAPLFVLLALIFGFGQATHHLPLLAGLVVAVLLVPYVFGPVLIHNTQKSAVEVRFEPIDLASPSVPVEVSNYFRAVGEELVPQGFAPVETLAMSTVMTNLTGHVALFRDERTKEVAKLLGSVAGTGVARRIALLAVFHTEFGDGTEVITSNSRAPRIFPPIGEPVHTFTFPLVEYTGRLLTIHRALSRRFDAGRTRVDPIGRDSIAFQKRVEVRQLEKQVEWGYYKLDEAEGVQRPTWKGALLMTWRMLPPWKQIRHARRLRQAERTLRELEMEGMLA